MEPSIQKAKQKKIWYHYLILYAPLMIKMHLGPTATAFFFKLRQNSHNKILYLNHFKV